MFKYGKVPVNNIVSGKRMKHHLSSKYIAKRKRGMLIGSFMYFSIASIFSYIGFVTENYGMLVGLIFLVIGWKGYSNISPWVQSSSKLSYRVENNNLVAEGDSFEHKVSITNLKKLVVQVRKKKVLSILLFSKDGELNKLEGLENIEGFITDISDCVGEENVKYARYFHR